MFVSARNSLLVRAFMFVMIAGITGCSSGGSSIPNYSDTALRSALQSEITDYSTTHRTSEHVSAVSLSVSLRGAASNIDVAAGTTEYGGSVALPTDSLLQIGSNTKAFTGVTMLQLEAEGKLSIEDTVAKWLPQYPAWGSITIRQLLNMTSGIATYDAQNAFLTAYGNAPLAEFSKAQLVSYASGIPLLPMYNYTNTGYILAAMIIEKASNDTYANQIQKRIIGPLGLTNTFYRTDFYPSSVVSRMPAGYFADPTLAAFAPILYKDVDNFNLSWGQSAGGIVASMEDLTKWTRALYEGRMLAPAQQTELERIISTKSGLPIATTSATDPEGYGLGVVQVTLPSFGKLWYYLGGTFGYRVYHVYDPASGTVFAVGLNSSPTLDDSGKLVLAILTSLHSAGHI